MFSQVVIKIYRVQLSAEDSVRFCLYRLEPQHLALELLLTPSHNNIYIYAGNTSTPAGRTLAEHHEADMLAYPGIHAERGPMRGKARLHTCLRWLRAATSELAWLIGAATTRTARVARHSEHAPTLERCTAGNLSPSRVNILYKRAGQGGV